jgi:hypothetical protein
VGPLKGFGEDMLAPRVGPYLMRKLTGQRCKHGSLKALSELKMPNGELTRTKVPSLSLDCQCGEHRSLFDAVSQ